MSLLSRGIAHVSFKGGGICVPARSPYDRQLLAEQVMSQCRSKGTVQVLLDDDRWMVHTHIGAGPVYCVQCGRRSNSVCYSESHNGTFCVACAVGEQTKATPPADLARREADS
jgi:hypothetical protein